MNYRNSTLLDAADLGEAGTKDIEIKIKEPISRITLQWIVTKTKQAMDAPCHKDITSVELKAGSDVLFGLDGGQLQALNILNRRVGTMNHGQEINANSQRSVYGLDFGRFLYDPLLALDPRKFDSLILYVTFDEDISDTGVSSNTLEVWADTFDEKVINPIGFLRAFEHDNRTPPSSGYVPIRLPVDEVIRTLLIQGYRDGYEPWYQVAEARLDEDGKKRIIFDHDLEVYHQLRKGEDVEVTEQLLGEDPASGTVFYLTPTDYWCHVIPVQRGGTASFNVGSTARGGKVTITASASAAFAAIVKGWCPNHCFHFPFGNPQDPDDWYDVTNGRVEHLRLRLKAGSGGANGTWATILQTLRRY